MGYVSKEDPKTMPQQIGEFTASVFVADHPGQLKPAQKKGEEWVGGFTPTIHVRTAKSPCQMKQIKWKWESQQRTRRWRIQLSLKLEILLKLFFVRRCLSSAILMITASHLDVWLLWIPTL